MKEMLCSKIVITFGFILVISSSVYEQLQQGFSQEQLIQEEEKDYTIQHLKI